MLTLEKILSANKGKGNIKEFLKNISNPEEISTFIDEHERKNILDVLRKVSYAHDIYNNVKDLPIDQAVAEVANGFLESIRDARKKKVILSVPFNPQKGSTILDSLIYILNHLTYNDDNIKGNDKYKLNLIWEEVCGLVSKGNYVSEKMLKLLPEDVIKKREDYLSNLKKIASESVDNDETNKIVVERDNQCYFVKYSAECTIIPIELLSHSELQSLDAVGLLHSSIIDSE